MTTTASQTERPAMTQVPETVETTAVIPGVRNIPGLPPIPAIPTVNAAWSEVMRDVLSVGKGGFAKAFGEGGGGFRFRGVDAVVDAVGPALRRHRVTVLPKKIISIEAVEYETKKGSRMINKQVRVRWQVRGPGGDSFTGESVGEAADSGDKSISKAQSVAYRVFLLQALCIPTGETDPDMNVHERASRNETPGQSQTVVEVDPEAEAANDARGELLAKLADFGWDSEKLVRRYWDDYRKNLRNTRDVVMIQQFGAALYDEEQARRADAGRTEVEVAAVAAARQRDAAEAMVAPADDEQGVPEPSINDRELRRLHTLLSKEKVTGHDARVQWCSEALGMPVASTKNLTTGEAARLIAKLEQMGRDAAPVAGGNDE